MMRTADEIRAAQQQRVMRCGRIVIGCVIVAICAITVRVVQLKVMPDPKLHAAAGSIFSHESHLTRRGDLVDRRGRVIATSSLGYRLFIDPRVVSDLSTIAVDLDRFIDIDLAKVDQQIAARPDSRYIVIDQLVEGWEADAIRQANLKGVGLTPRLVRNYPHGELAATFVGRVGFEHTGQSGAEDQFNREMLPEPGTLEYLRDAQHRPLWIEPEGYDRGQDGLQVQLSIDLVIQEIAERRLRETVKKYNAGGGRMIVLDPWTGEILALCDYLRQGTEWAKVVSDDTRWKDLSLGRNRCATDPYEPGSTFKPFVWAVATELGRAKPSEMIDCPENGEVYRTSFGRRIRDSFYYGRVSWETVLIKSLNSGMAIVAERMTHREMRDVLTRFGFGAKTNCGLAGETAGLVTEPKKWNDYTQTSVSFGHEVGVTPLQMVQAYSAFARDGTMPQLRITSSHPNEVSYQIVRRVLSKDAALTTRRAMRRVMTDGSGRKAQSEKYEIFGKSGTPQLPNPKGGGYFEQRYMPGFIGGAPYRDPRIVVLCVIEDPDRTIGHYGGAVAGPCVRDVIDETLEYLGIPADIVPEAENASLIAHRGD